MGNALKSPFKARRHSDPCIQPGSSTDKLTEDSANKRGVKRKHEADDGETTSLVHITNSSLLDTPKRKRIKSTSKYIYETLFLKGQDSDVKIIALGKEWNLHKLYLKQAGYFSNMFSGSWSETCQDTINVNIPDDNIDSSSLYIAFGSLYKDGVFIKPSQVTGVLAAATFLQLDGLIQQCVVMMKDTMQSSTVCLNLSVSEMYGLLEIKELCFEWLFSNLLTKLNVQLLKDIPPNLLCTLLDSSELLVVRVETDVYCMLRKWLFIQTNMSWSGSDKDIIESSTKFFKQEYEDNGCCYLETPNGQEFLPIFSLVRWNYILNDITSLNILKSDKIIPLEWLEPIIAFNWNQMLNVEQSLDPGPVDISDDMFGKHCSRNGRLLETDMDYCWRWVGYSYGLDLLVTYTTASKIFTLKRNCFRQPSPYSVDNQPLRYVYYRLTVFKFDDNGKIEYKQSSDIKTKCFGKDEETLVMNLSGDFHFPFYVSFNALIVTPSEDHPCPGLKVPKQIMLTNSHTQTESFFPSVSVFDHHCVQNVPSSL